VPQVSGTLTGADRLGGLKARWGINRLNYLVPPGLYALGEPTPQSPAVVTANYKMSYDLVRQALAGRSVWLLVLETYGINVWCAAGKGTFGTGELVRRVEKTGLGEVVSHRRLILPILGAPGVAAHEVKRRTGFSVAYATIRAEDLPAYLDNGQLTTPAMRQLTFSLYERLVLVPVEIVLSLKSVSLAGAAIFLVALLWAGVPSGLIALAAYLGAVLAGLAVAPLLLPVLPGKSFAIKGAVLGLVYAALFYGVAGGAGWNRWVASASFLALPALSAYHTLNFTGCTPFTSRSGVKKEMRLSFPLLGGALLVALLLVIVGRVLS